MNSKIETSDDVLVMGVVSDYMRDAPTPESHPELVPAFKRWKAAGYPGIVASSHPPGTNPAFDFAFFVRSAERADPAAVAALRAHGSRR